MIDVNNMHFMYALNGYTTTHDCLVALHSQSSWGFTYIRSIKSIIIYSGYIFIYIETPPEVV